MRAICWGEETGGVGSREKFRRPVGQDQEKLSSIQWEPSVKTVMEGLALPYSHSVGRGHTRDSQPPCGVMRTRPDLPSSGLLTPPVLSLHHPLEHP